MWAQICSAALGIWLMCSPAILSYGDPAKDNDRIVGPTAASFAIIAICEATRPMRWLNVLAGIWLVAAPWVLGYAETSATVNSVCVGLGMALLSLVRGRIDARYGGGWSVLIKGHPKEG